MPTPDELATCRNRGRLLLNDAQCRTSPNGRHCPKCRQNIFKCKARNINVTLSPCVHPSVKDSCVNCPSDFHDLVKLEADELPDIEL